MLKNVDLPLPLPPMIVTNSPSFISTLISFNAIFKSSILPVLLNFFNTLLTLRIVLSLICNSEFSFEGSKTSKLSLNSCSRTSSFFLMNLFFRFLIKALTLISSLILFDFS